MTDKNVRCDSGEINEKKGCGHDEKQDSGCFCSHGCNCPPRARALCVAALVAVVGTLTYRAVQRGK